MKVLVKYLKPYWKTAVLAPFFMILESGADLLQPILLSNIVDKGIANNDIHYILTTCTAMICIAVFAVFAGIICNIFASIASQNYGTDLRQGLFNNIQTFSFDNLDTFKTASLITRLTNDVSQVQNILLSMLRMFIRAPILCIGGIAMTLLINPGIASILLVTIPLLIIAVALIIKKGFPIFTKVQQSIDKVNTVMHENLSDMRVVKAFVRSDYEIKRFGQANDQLVDFTMKGSRLIGLTMPSMMLMMSLSIVAVMWFGGIKVNTGNMQVGEVMAVINYMSQILFSLLMISFMLMMFSRAKVSADRIIEVLETKTDISDNPDIKEHPINSGRIDFINVSFRYPGTGGEPVLKNLNFCIQSRETLGILGATGSGKSTLVNLLPRFYNPTEGTVLIDGTDVKNIKIETLRKNISIVLQESILFSGTIIDNIRWGKSDASLEEVIEAAKAAQAHDFISSFTDGYDTILGQKGVNLSGGQKQRISIARALLKNPKILILDDSTSAVDTATESRIQDAIKKSAVNTTCLIIAQRISSVIEADKIIVLDDGKIADMGSHSELIERCAVYQDIYNSQLGKEAL